MPWTPVNSIAPQSFTADFTGGGRSTTVFLGDLSTGDLFDIVCSFPADIVVPWYSFNPTTAENLEFIHVANDPANNRVTIRARTTTSSVNFGSVNLTFDPREEDAPNYSIRIAHA